MDRAGVATAVVSCTERGVWFGDDFEQERPQAIRLAREVNEFGAKMMSDYKGRFGLFAVLPLPDIDASLREIEYAFDTLKADGVGLLTNYSNHWLGDKAFQPVFDELNRRNAVVYSHPTDGPCCHHIMPDGGTRVVHDAAEGAVDWFTDTTRSIYSLINDGTPDAPKTSMATRYANIRFIWSHAGGSLLGFAGRFLGSPPDHPVDFAAAPRPNSRLYHLRRFYYDTANSANPVEMHALKEFVGISQIVFGSDFPYWTLENMTGGLQKCGFSPAELRAINRENALRILPKFKV
jgi:6-methylsalicylate decarboxylase